MSASPAQQSTKRTVTRSELSSNRLTKIDTTPRDSNNTTLQGLSSHLKRENFQQHKAGIDRPQSPSRRKSLRGEDDPRTLQAIAEGRRLYVGHLSYIAKTQDVEELFARDEYNMFVRLCQYSINLC